MSPGLRTQGLGGNEKKASRKASPHQEVGRGPGRSRSGSEHGSRFGGGDVLTLGHVKGVFYFKLGDRSVPAHFLSCGPHSEAAPLP